MTQSTLDPDLIIVTEYGGIDEGVPESTLYIHRRTGELYVNGSKIVTEKRFSFYERTLATIGLMFAGLGAASATVLAVIEIGRVAKWWM